ncbi:MAG: hypothetical protein DRJ64_01490 [Thermoprotei archaeon]|nr:MAG: hypothetical protein DRJ64_01490 [Thermoprotei archaeon]
MDKDIMEKLQKIYNFTKNKGITLLYGPPKSYKTLLVLYILSHSQVQRKYYIANTKHKRIKLQESGIEVYKSNSFVEEIALLFELEKKIKLCNIASAILAWDTIIGNFSFITAYLENTIALKLLFLALNQMRHLNETYGVKIIIVSLSEKEDIPLLWKYMRNYVLNLIQTKIKNDRLIITLKNNMMETEDEIKIPLKEILHAKFGRASI